MLRLLLMLLGLAFTTPVQAACALAATSSPSFTPSSSYDVRNGAVASVTAPPTLSCSGTLIVLLSSNSARATVTSANGFTLRNSANDSIAYRLSADSAGTRRFTQGGTIDYFDPSILSLLGILNGGNFVPTMYAALTDTPNIPAGTYTDIVTINWSWDVCHLLGVLGICVLGESGTGTTTMTVTIVVGKDCRISAPNLSFNSAPLASQFTSITQSVAVDCTKNAAYTVSFTNGNSGASRPWRAMSDGAGNVLQYNIYRADGSTIWDLTNPLQSAVAGTGSLTPAQLQVYVAKINPDQPTPPAGHYTDTVSVLIAF